MKPVEILVSALMLAGACGFPPPATADEPDEQKAPTPPADWRSAKLPAGVIAPERLAGFLQTPWRRTIEAFREHHLDAIDQVGAARVKWEQA